MDRGQRSWGTSLLMMQVRKPGLMHLYNLPDEVKLTKS